jgi:hypothetical protein
MTLKSLKAKLSALGKERVRLVQANSKQSELMSRFQLDYHELAQQIEVVCYYTTCVLYRQALPYDVKMKQNIIKNNRISQFEYFNRDFGFYDLRGC